MIRREIHPKASLPPASEQAPANTIDFRSSDETLDRYQELISVSGWQLDNYRRNPIVQNAHSYCSLADTIGKSLITEVRGDYLFQRILFAVDENPMAKLAYDLYKGGFLNAVSVGFIPLRWENGNQDAGYRRIYLEQELLEVSAVSVPANPNALTLALKAGAIHKSDLKDLAAMLEALCVRSSEDGRLKTEDRELKTEVGGWHVDQGTVDRTVIWEEREQMTEDRGLRTEDGRRSIEEGGLQPADREPMTEHRGLIPGDGGPKTEGGEFNAQPTTENQFCNNQADPDSVTGALGAGVHEAQLLQLNKQLNEICALLKRA